MCAQMYMYSRHSICSPGFFAAPLFFYRIMSVTWIWFLNFTEILFPTVTVASSHIAYTLYILTPYIFMYILRIHSQTLVLRIYIHLQKNYVWRMQKVYAHATTQVEYKMYNVFIIHAFEHLPWTLSPRFPKRLPPQRHGLQKFSHI